jgi:hypothetical protein
MTGEGAGAGALARLRHLHRIHHHRIGTSITAGLPEISSAPSSIPESSRSFSANDTTTFGWSSLRGQYASTVHGESSGNWKPAWRAIQGSIDAKLRDLSTPSS